MPPHRSSASLDARGFRDLRRREVATVDQFMAHVARLGAVRCNGEVRTHRAHAELNDRLRCSGAVVDGGCPPRPIRGITAAGVKAVMFARSVERGSAPTDAKRCASLTRVVDLRPREQR